MIIFALHILYLSQDLLAHKKWIINNRLLLDLPCEVPIHKIIYLIINLLILIINNKLLSILVNMEFLNLICEEHK